MAWTDTLLSASFRGAGFEVLRTRDAGGVAAATREYPYRDGAEAEDMGRKARSIEISAVLFGKQYEVALTKLLKALSARGAGELVHPVFGPVQAQPLDWTVDHDPSHRDYAALTMRFLVVGLDVEFFSRTWPKPDAKADAARGAATSLLAKIVAKAKDADAMARAGLAAIAALRAQVASVVTSGAAILGEPAAWASDLTSLVTGIVDLRDFDSASLLPDFDAVYAALTKSILLPTFDSSGSSSGGSSSGGSPSGGSAIAAPPAVVAGTERDEVAAHVDADRALGVAEAAQEVFESEAETPTLTPDEIENVAAESRELLQTSIATYRGLYGLEDSRPVAEALRDVALAVQQAAEAVLLARPPVVAYAVPGRACPRLLAHRLYGDHSRAAEIVRLNDLADPNFLTAGQVLHVYAG